jgi:hypothetical protein
MIIYQKLLKILSLALTFEYTILLKGTYLNVAYVRFSDEQIKKLLEIKWWDWSTEKINQFCPLLCNENIDEFIKQALQSSIH